MYNENKNENNIKATDTARKLMSKFSTRKLLGLIFGVFMFLVYEGMGVLMLINFFGWKTDWAWTRWIVGVVLIIYGLYRGYRAYADITRPEDFDE